MPLPLALLAGLAIAAAVWLAADRRRLRRRLDAATRELQRLQTDFGRFAPSAVVDRIAARGAVDAERRDVTVLFADLVGFTALGERLPPEELVAILNAYFGRMSQVLQDHRGHVAKFIGDGLMALFGAIEPNPWQGNDAAHAALAMQRALTDYNAELAGRGGPTLRAGIGLHAGTAVAGILGSHALLEFTVIGGTVNRAARVERLTRTHNVPILLTDAVRAQLDPRFQLDPMPPTPVHGVGEPIATWALRGFGDR